MELHGVGEAERQDRADAEPRRRRLGAFGEAHHVVDGAHRARAVRDPRREFGGRDLRRELRKQGLTVAVEPEEHVREQHRHELRQRIGVGRRHVLDVRVVRPQRIDGLDQRGAEISAQDLFDLSRDGVGHRLIRPDTGKLQHRFPNHADAHVPQRPLLGVVHDVLGVAAFQDAGARHGGPHVARLIVARLRIAHRVQHPGGVTDPTTVDAGTVIVDVRADRVPEVGNHGLVRQQQRDRIVIRRSAAGHAGFLAQAAHRQIAADRNGGARARAQRGGTRRVIHAARIARPGAALIAQRRGHHHRRLVTPAGITTAAAAAASVVLGVDRLGVNDRALFPQLGDQRVVGRREIDVVTGIGGRGGTHVLRVEGILQTERNAVHGHRLQVGLRPVGLVELQRDLERVRVLAKILAHGRRSRRQRPFRRVAVRVALAGHRTLAAEVQRAQRVGLPRVSHAHRHAVLRMDARIGGGRLHAAELDRRPRIVIVVRQQIGDRHRLGGIFERGAGAHHARGGRNRCAVAGDELIGHAVVGPGAIEIHPDEPGTGELARLDGAMHVVDTRLLEAKLGLVLLPACAPDESEHTDDHHGRATEV